MQRNLSFKPCTMFLAAGDFLTEVEQGLARVGGKRLQHLLKRPEGLTTDEVHAEAAAGEELDQPSDLVLHQ
jgi:hypothetical protein